VIGDDVRVPHSGGGRAVRGRPRRVSAERAAAPRRRGADTVLAQLSIVRTYLPVPLFVLAARLASVIAFILAALRTAPARAGSGGDGGPPTAADRDRTQARDHGADEPRAPDKGAPSAAPAASALNQDWNGGRRCVRPDLRVQLRRPCAHCGLRSAGRRGCPRPAEAPVKLAGCWYADERWR
jgi:hypothetical protein